MLRFPAIRPEGIPEMSVALPVAQTTTAAAVTPSATPVTNHVCATYLVSGVADAGLLSRVLEPVAKLGLVPERVHALREGPRGGSMTVDFSLSAVSARHAELVEFALRAIVGVHRVLVKVDLPN